MSNNFPLIVNVGSGQIQELPAGDNLDLSGSNISNVGNVTIASNAVINTVKSDNYQYANGSPLSIPASAGGSNTQVQYNNNGALGGISTVTYNGSVVSLGSNAQISITGGSANQFLKTDGSGSLSWATAGGGGLSGNATGNINMDVYNLQLRTYEETVYDNGAIFGPSPITFNAQNGTIQKYQLNGGPAQKSVLASNMTNCTPGGSYTWIINNQSIANTFGTSDFYWAGGSKTFSDSGTGIDIISIFTPDGTTFYASIVKGFVQV